jgi:hypothetical protein
LIYQTTLITDEGRTTLPPQPVCSEDRIGSIIDHIRQRCAKSGLDSPSINITREGWDQIILALQTLNSFERLLQQHAEFAAQIENLTGRDPRLPIHDDPAQGRLELKSEAEYAAEIEAVKGGGRK